MGAGGCEEYGDASYVPEESRYSEDSDMNYFTKHSHIPSPQSSRADSAYEEEASLIPKSNFKKGTDIDVVAERVRLLAGDDGNDDDDEEENSMVVKVDIDEDECGPGGWPMPSEAEREAKKALEKKMRKRALWLSILTLVLSIPALIGTWCWPALVAGFVGSGATAMALFLGHSVAFGVTLALMIGLSVYTGWCSSKRRGNHIQRYGPLYCTLIAAPLIMMDPTTHFLDDIFHLFPNWSTGFQHAILACTYTGFAFLVIGSLWNANIVQKLRDIRMLWRELKMQDKDEQEE